MTLINIELLGITDSQELIQWMDLVEEAVDFLELDADLQIVDELEKFMDYNLTGIPAIVLDGAVIYQKELPDLEDLLISFNQRNAGEPVESQE